MRGLFQSVVLSAHVSSRFDAGGVNASQIASGRTIQNRNGMTHLAFAQHKFGREENAGGKRLFRSGAGVFGSRGHPDELAG